MRGVEGVSYPFLDTTVPQQCVMELLPLFDGYPFLPPRYYSLEAVQGGLATNATWREALRADRKIALWGGGTAWATATGGTSPRSRYATSPPLPALLTPLVTKG